MAKVDSMAEGSIPLWNPSKATRQPVMKPRTTTFSYNPDEIKKLIADDLDVDPEHIEVKYVIQEVGADVLDRFPGTKQVTSVRVTVEET